jgi:hypothetical protein
MTLDALVVTAGVVLSFSSLGVLASLWGFRRRRALCLKASRDAACERACLRTCHLPDLTAAKVH